MANKLYIMIFFHLLLKKFRPLSDFTFESEVCDFSHRGYGNGFFWDCLVKLHDNSFQTPYSVSVGNFFEVRFQLIMLWEVINWLQTDCKHTTSNCSLSFFAKLRLILDNLKSLCKDKKKQAIFQLWWRKAAVYFHFLRRLQA